MLYLVATPIGNLADMTLRALETLRAVDVIAAEDTRKTSILLNYYHISKPQLAFHEHNEEQAGRKILDLLMAGKSVAVVSEAGTPGISDPGFSIVRQAVESGIKVTVIPGATAVTTAVVLSGLPAHSFTFRGFPPRKSGKRKNFLAVDINSPHTLVFYESPHRLRAFLQDAFEVYGDRQTAVCNELTKLYETIHRGRLSDHIAHFAQEEPRGEYVVVIAGHEER
ncbi:MAG: 16S rRNA (cytidine(1402)-2'-O)-methyltransferase [Chloroflexi bacterium]|nr:16S rRNA (cytidine(1402)-2'-O)-methyltransferase [Ardenticatenaceae bacterium]MBL1131509.1 16S rRNA (cytidine(1402)-2'-O)-methyltransferase [Chloroflexota bacterium]NOG37620.1 16S rRNA (cytidine(1402)-2'-O)-methyltransferase [Chloroflexota bacterium]GIK55598.1 MAG: ribosomal RNA small subunit methyltransferase I [Chloroflexota bacterium]